LELSAEDRERKLHLAGQQSRGPAMADAWKSKNPAQVSLSEALEFGPSGWDRFINTDHYHVFRARHPSSGLSSLSIKA